MRYRKIIKVDNIEGWLDSIFIFIQLQPIVNYFTQVVIIKIINKHGKAFFYMLLHDMLNNKPTLTCTRTSNHQQSSEWIDDIYPAFSNPVF